MLASVGLAVEEVEVSVVDDEAVVSEVVAVPLVKSVVEEVMSVLEEVVEDEFVVVVSVLLEFCVVWLAGWLISEKNVFAFLTAIAVQLKRRSDGADLLRSIVNPLVLLLFTR